jgi:DNA invertase Pin-like site-specific DNA recombinase
MSTAKSKASARRRWLVVDESFRENIDTGGPFGRAIIVIVGAIAELERNLIIERVRAGMRRARLEGRHIGRQPLTLDEPAILNARASGHSLRQIAKTLRISTATVRRVLHTNTSPQTTGELAMTVTSKPV